VGLSEVLALYARPPRIRGSVLCPGGVDTHRYETERAAGMTPEQDMAEAAVTAKILGNRVMNPAQVEEIVVEAVRRGRFFILANPCYRPMLLSRAQDLNAFIEARLRG
jgi:hypothetical protein